MSKQELKSLLSQAYELEAELIRVVKQCLQEIFPDDKGVVCEFLEDVENGMEWSGCLQGITHIRSNREFVKNRAKELAEKNKNEKSESESKD